MKRYVKACLIAAIIFTVLGIATFVTTYFVFYSDRRAEKTDFELSFKGDVSGIDIDSSYGSFRVVRGDEVKVSVKNANPDECHIELDNTILRVYLDSADDTSVCDWKLSPYEDLITTKRTDVTITVPESLELLYCDLGSGNFKVENLDIGRLVSQVCIGNITFDNVNFRSERYIQCEAGFLDDNGERKLLLNHSTSSEDI